MNVAKIHKKLMITESQFYFANISATKSRIFMKFKTQAYKILIDHQKKIHKDLCTHMHTRIENAHAHDLARARAFTTVARACVHRSSQKFLWWQINI